MEYHRVSLSHGYSMVFQGGLALVGSPHHTQRLGTQLPLAAPLHFFQTSKWRGGSEVIVKDGLFQNQQHLHVFELTGRGEHTDC